MTTRRRILPALLLAALAQGSAWAQPTYGGEGTTLPLTGTYHGADDSVLSLRAAGSTVVGYSLDPQRRRSFVFSGTRSGAVITGQYWTLPRGDSTAQGTLQLTVSNGGSTLLRTGGDAFGTGSWVSKLPGHFVFPKGGEARWQSTSASDLDGAYKGHDGSRAWVRQPPNSQFIWYAERFASSGDARPVFATIGIGQRAANGSLVGSTWDLPHQTAPMNQGIFYGGKAADSRSFAMQSYVLPLGTMPAGTQMPYRIHAYRADYAVDLDRLAQELHQRIGPFTVGYSFSIAQDGHVVRSEAGGLRRAPTAGNGLMGGLPMHTDVLFESASTSKLVTLVAMLKVLRDKGISVDSPVSPYLPQSWSRGTGMSTVTFRQLLSHRARPSVGNSLFKPGDCGASAFHCLRQAVETGLTEAPGYDNIHYTLFRLILPWVNNPLAMWGLFANEADVDVINATYSAWFRDYVRQMLQSTGVDADFKYVYGLGEAGAYRYTWGTPPSGEIAPWIDASEDDYLEAGSGGLKIKPKEFARFLSRLERGDVLHPADLALAKEIGYGGFSESPAAGPGGVGPLWTKSGGATGVASQLMVFPGTEIYLAHNSRGHPNEPDSLASLLRSAWQAALVTAP